MKPAIIILPVLGLLLPACSKSKRDQCMCIIRLMKTEALATDAMIKKKPGALSDRDHARLLEKTAAKLRDMDVSDPELESAIKSYIGALGALDDLETAPADLAATLTSLESSRRRVADECNR
jgi:hypothetical protein